MLPGIPRTPKPLRDGTSDEMLRYGCCGWAQSGAMRDAADALFVPMCVWTCAGTHLL